MNNLADYVHYPNIHMSRIAPAEIEETVALINKAYAYQNSYKQASRTNPAHLRKNAADNEFYVAKQGGKIVGCVYVKNGPGSTRFGLLTVADELRGRGLGRALIEAVESYAMHNGAKSVELDYMSAAPWLRPYYERHGYAETGEVVNWGAIDLIHMSKPLGGAKQN
jgi:predicted N-acetyltransferase YhbS